MYLVYVDSMNINLYFIMDFAMNIILKQHWKKKIKSEQ